MNSISWKDIEGDDSSLSDLSSDMEDQCLPPNHSNQLKKVLSSPPISHVDPLKKQNLEKLSNHQGQKVWVYSPNFYKGQEEQVNQIINNMNFVEESSRFTQGWNILLTTEHAKKLISEGFNTTKFKLKFIYSTKNDKVKENKQKHKNYKNQRPYKSPDHYLDKPNNPKYSKFKEKINEENKPKKKVKYIAKQQPNQEKKEPSESSPPKKQQIIEEEINEPEPLKEEVQTNGSVKKELEPEKQSPPEEKKSEYERDSEESLEEMKKKIKKKKNNKKKTKKQQGDNNNPFSFFDQ